MPRARSAERGPTGGWSRIVEPYSVRSERRLAAGLALAIVAAMTVRLSALGPSEAMPALAPYQRLDESLSAQSAHVYRTLLSSVGDIEELRAEEGQWPEVSLLEEAGAPPFARDLMPPPADALHWVSYDGGSWVDYLGTGAAGEGTSFVLRLIDLHGAYHPHPHPGVDYDPNLSVAAQVWIFDAAGRDYPGERLPEAGWTWVLARTDPILQARRGRAAASDG